MEWKKRSVSGFLAVVLSISLIFGGPAVYAEEEEPASLSETEGELPVSGNEDPSSDREEETPAPKNVPAADGEETPAPKTDPAADGADA